MDFTSTTNFAFVCLGGKIARQQHADLVGEDFAALIVHHAAAVAVAVKAQAEVGALLLHRIAHGMQHLQVFGIGIVFGEGEIELGVHADHFGADAAQRFRRKRTRRAVAAGRDHLDRARQLVALGHGLKIGLAHVGHGDIGAAGALLALAVQHDLLDAH